VSRPGSYSAPFLAGAETWRVDAGSAEPIACDATAGSALDTVAAVNAGCTGGTVGSNWGDGPKGLMKPVGSVQPFGMVRVDVVCEIPCPQSYLT
jgi:hypothetical protein